jgi:hypothetical protein
MVNYFTFSFPVAVGVPLSNLISKCCCVFPLLGKTSRNSFAAVGRAVVNGNEQQEILLLMIPSVKIVHKYKIKCCKAFNHASFDLVCLGWIGGLGQS